MNREIVTFADIFIVTQREFTTTFAFPMNIHSQIYWCNTFTNMLYTTIFAGKKVNIVPNFKINFMRFNVHGRISSSSYVWFYFTESDQSRQLKQFTRHLQTASCLSFPAAKEVVTQPAGSCVLLMPPLLWESSWGMFWFEAETGERGLAQGHSTWSSVCLDLAFDLGITI